MAAMALVGGYFVITKPPKKLTPACSGDAPVFIPTNGGELLLGALNRTQTFSTGHVLTVMGVPVPVCTSISSITIPASTSYKVTLEKQWEIRLRDDKHELVVIAPRITPLLPVAFNTAGIRKNAAGCVLLNSQHTLNALEQGITAELKKYAESPVYINEVKQLGRGVVVKFVKNWLVNQKQYEHAASYTIKVFFADEPISYY